MPTSQLPANLPFAFGANEFTTQPWTFEEDVQRYAELGVAAIEGGEQKLDPTRLPEQLAQVAAHGLTISAVQLLVRTFGASQLQPEPTGVPARAAWLRQRIERLASFAPGCPFVANTGVPEQGNVAGAPATRRAIPAPARSKSSSSTCRIPSIRVTCAR